MTKRDKLRRKLRNNPADATMREVQTLLEGFGFFLDRVSGSHHLFIYEVEDNYQSISIPLHGRKVKKVYVKRVCELLDTLFPEDEVEDQKMTVKTIDDYLALPYTLEIIPDEGAWFIQIKELPGCMTEVDEWDEILPMIEDAKRLWIEAALTRGREIPEPLGVPSN